MIRQRPLCIFARSFLCSVGVLPDGQACTQRSESTRICALRFVLRSVGILPDGQACASQSQPTSHTPVQQTGQGYDATSDRESRSGGTLPGWQDYPRLLLAVRALRIQSRTANHEHGFSPITHYSSRITRAARLMLRSVGPLHGQAEARRSASACILAVPGRLLRSVGACTRRPFRVGFFRFGPHTRNHELLFPLIARHRSRITCAVRLVLCSGGTVPGWQDYPRLLLAVRALRIQSRTANHEHGFSPIAHYSSRITRAARLMLRSVELLHGQAEVRRSASACILAVPGRSLRSVGACTRRLPAVGYRPTTPDRRLWTGDCGLVPVDCELTTHDFRLSFLSRTSSFEPAFRLITHHSSLVTSSAGGLP